MSEKVCHTIAIWLIEKVAYQNSRAVEKVFKLLADICTYVYTYVHMCTQGNQR